jgi:alpha-L-fucosidase
VSCSRDGGNYLLNIGPRGDGSIPGDSVRVLGEVGAWLSRNNESIHTTDRCNVRHSEFGGFTRRGNTLYMHVHFWPGDTVALGGLTSKVKSARLLASGHEVKFDQEAFRVRFTGLPTDAPDLPVTTLAIECDSEPIQDTRKIRTDRPRNGVGI